MSRTRLHDEYTSSSGQEKEDSIDINQGDNLVGILSPIKECL